MKRLLLGASVLALVVLIGAGWLHRVRRGPGFARGEVAVEGIGGPVEILRDSLGIPHVWASSREDAFFAQGYLHASDRLWQMELLRRVAAGRLSEIMGPATVATDRFLRSIGMSRAAEEGLRVLDPETRRVLGAYVAGLNAAIAGWKGPLPPEFVLLRHRPEPWTEAQALSLEKVMAWDLAEYGRTLSLAESRARLGESGVARVLSPYPEWGPTIVDGWPAGGRARWLMPPGGPAPVPDAEVPRGRSGAAPGDRLPSTPERLLAAATPPAGAERFLDAGSASRASNAWVVAGDRSASGKPLLANDMHLALDAPNIWYLVGLHAPGVEVVGMSLPGTPGVVAGHTRGAAWGFTNAAVDDTDLFLERVDPADSTRYLTREGSRPFETRTEEIRIAGREAPDTLRVRSTRHGPVITDVEARAGGRLLALRWAAHDPSPTARAVLALNAAGSVQEIVDALRDFRNPHQNVVFADTAGRWGYWMAGRVPLRRSGRPPTFPVPGWTGEHDWIGALPFEEHPHALEPAEGFVVTANNRQTTDTVSDLVGGGGWAEPYRAIRIRELIEARPLHDLSSMHAIQLDVGSARVRRLLPLAVRSFRDAGLEDEAERLEGWDGGFSLASTEATLFHTWWTQLRSARARHLYGGAGGYFPSSALERALTDGIDREALSGAARRAAELAGGLAWGDAHTLTLDHALSEVPVAGTLFGFGRSGIPREGGPHSPNVAASGGAAPPYEVTHGPSQRHVVDLADVDAGGFVLPGGQSGFPGSPHAFDQLELWRGGGLIPLPLDRETVERRAAVRLTLVPRPSAS